MTVTPLNAEQTVNWTQRLENAGVAYRLWKDGSIDRITLDEQDAEAILGISSTPKASPASKILVAVILGVMVLFIGLCSVLSGPSEPPTFADQMHEQYGRLSPWLLDYADHIATTHLRNPSSYRTEEVRIIPIDQDSIVHVLIYSGVNDFNVRKIQSITTVVNAKTGQIQRVVSHNQE